MLIAERGRAPTVVLVTALALGLLSTPVATGSSPRPTGAAGGGSPAQDPAPRAVSSRLQTVELTTEGGTGSPGRTELSVTAVDEGGHEVTTTPMTTDPFRLVAVTWPTEANRHGHDSPSVQVRYRSDRQWSQWFPLPHGEHAPDTRTREGRRPTVRQGTDPLLVPSSDGVQVRVQPSGRSVPEGLRLDLIDPGESPADALDSDPAGGGTASTELAQAALAPAATSGAPRPAIRTRQQWGADERIRRGRNRYGQIKAAFVHHTVNANSYSKSDVPRIIRSIYAYHVRSLGWDDVGYNFLVDKWGRIWEGRRGGVGKPVTGAHTYGHNDDAFAMSAIGTYTSARPSQAMLAAYARLFAWKFDLHGIRPRGSTSLDGVRVRTVSGHRDTYATACPGDVLYSRLGTIRRATAVRTDPVRIGKRAQLRVRLAKQRVRREEPVRLGVKLPPRAAGAPVWVQRKTKRSPDWSSFRRTRLDEDGKARVRLRESRRATVRYRVVSATIPQRVSDVQMLRVRR